MILSLNAIVPDVNPANLERMPELVEVHAPFMLDTSGPMWYVTARREEKTTLEKVLRLWMRH
jgi:hypothetical protein